MYFFSGNFWKTYLVALVAMATHPILDYMNNYGVRPFLPFNGTWYYGDLLFIFDPYIDVALFLGLVAGSIRKRNRRIFDWLSLILVTTYIGGRIELRRMAASQMERYAAQTPDAQEWAVLPTMLNPLVWDGIVKTSTHWVKVRLHSTEGVQSELARIERGRFSDVAYRAAEAKSAAALLRFARFPAVRVETTESGYRVLFMDFRFYNERTKTAAAAEVDLDRSFRITKQSVSFIEPVD
jgi:hypothetical protein